MNSSVRIDLHVHSTYSPDSRLRLEAAVEQLGAVGLQGIALTDHNTLEGHAALRAIAAHHPRAILIPGVEVSTRQGHVLVYGVSELPPRGRPLAELLDWSRSRDAVVVLAHPFRWTHGAGRRVAERAAVHDIEARNGRNGEVANLKAEVIAARRGLGATGGSDAHELSSLGRSFTEFPEEVTSADEALRLLKEGRCVASGHSLPLRARFAVSFRNGLLRVGRGFRSL